MMPQWISYKMGRDFIRILWIRSAALLGIFAIIPSATSIARADDGAKRSVVGSFYYINAARTFFLSVKNGSLLAGPVVPRLQLGSQNDALQDEALGAPAEDCSDKTFRCVKSSFQVFAVPRTRLAPATHYAMAGMAFRVVKCLRGDKTVCQVAVIEADCQTRIIKMHTCKLYSGDPRKNPDPGGITYFIYNEDFGVTSVGVTGSKKNSTEAVAAASVYILQGKAGLLK